MKKLLALVLVTAFAMPTFAADKKPAKPAAKAAVVKKEVKKHKKFEGTAVPEPTKKK